MPRDARRRATLVTSASLLLLGVAIIVRTVVAGGQVTSMGILLGVLFGLAGAGRMWIALRSER